MSLKTQNKILLPRPYFSWSQLQLWETSQKQYIQHYILGKERGGNKYTELGSRLSDVLEKGELPANSLEEHAKLLSHPYPNTNYEYEAFLTLNKQEIKLYGIFDGFDGIKHHLGDNKTGKVYTQKKADELGQITFYNLMYWLNKKKLFKQNAIHWFETKESDSELSLTGRIETFYTERTLLQCLQMAKGIEKAIIEIDKLMYSAL